MNKTQSRLKFIFLIQLISIALPKIFIKTKMLKTIKLFSFIFLFGLSSQAQTDSTDLILSTSPAILQTQMDSVLFGEGGYEQYELTFTISDTANFGHVNVEFALTNGQVLSKLNYTLSELQSANLIDSNWAVNIDFGKFETSQAYKVSLIIGNYAGVLSSSISKHY